VVRGALSQDAFGEQLGVAKDTIGKYERNRIVPGGDVLARIRADFGIDINWLLTGEGPVRPSGLEATDTPVERVRGNVVSMSGVSTHSVPVLGLAECGLAGWYQDGPMAVRAARPGDLRDPNAFAVLAVGDSMIPAGISPGYLCFCSPADPADIGDAVYVERADGHATIKLFGGAKDGWVRLQGWLPRQNGDGGQESYIDRIRIDNVIKIATVIYVKRKL
jgi:phage repressor protein C with HTH and peptisase S24 domain